VKPDGRTRVAEALAKLEERERLVLALARLDGLGAAEIARVLGGTAAEAARDLVLAERKLARRVRVRLATGPALCGCRPATPRAQSVCSHAARAHEERSRWRA
jgi:hypothetical protein